MKAKPLMGFTFWRFYWVCAYPLIWISKPPQGATNCDWMVGKGVDSRKTYQVFKNVHSVMYFKKGKNSRKTAYN